MRGHRQASARGRCATAPAATLGATVATVAALVVVAAAGMLVALTERDAAGAAQDDDSWRPVLLRAAEASRQRRFSGEALTIVWSDGLPRVSLSQVHRDRDTLTMASADGVTLQFGDEGGRVVDHRQGWLAPLPAVDEGAAVEAVRELERKYEVILGGEERLLDRPCTRLDVRRREDGSLRERLWVDQDSGLVLRRESYEGATRRLRLMAYLSLDLRARPIAGGDMRAMRGQSAESLDSRARDSSAVDGPSLEALRRAGWTVPQSLPGGYDPVGAYAVDGADDQPLQVVYRDGLYTVSVFQQRGRPDWSLLPDGATRAEGLDWPAYEWPGAVPRRLVWEGAGTTFSLVGDAPPQEFMAIAKALPRPEDSSLTGRLRRGLGRLLFWMRE